MTKTSSLAASQHEAVMAEAEGDARKTPRLRFLKFRILNVTGKLLVFHLSSFLVKSLSSPVGPREMSVEPSGNLERGETVVAKKTVR